MPKSSLIPVVCFEISQNPAEKTDYYFTVKGSTSHLSQIETWLWQMHTALASPVLPDDEALVASSTMLGPNQDVHFCLCRAKRVVPQNGGRDFLHFVAIFASLDDLMESNINPLALYYSNVWGSIQRKREGNFNASCTVSSTVKEHIHPDELTRRLAGDQQASAEYLAPTFENAIGRVQRSLDQLGWQQIAHVSFGVGTPIQCQLPISPTLVVRVAPAEKQLPSLPASENQRANGDQLNYQSRLHHKSVGEAVDAYKSYVIEVAQDLVGGSCAPPLWTARLWNHCQNSLAVVDTVERTGSLAPYQQPLRAVHNALLADLERSGARGGSSASSELQGRWEALERAQTMQKARWKNVAFYGGLAIVLVALAWLFLIGPRRGGDATRPIHSSTVAPSK